MLQIFQLDILNVDLGVAHATMAIHVCFKCSIYFRRMLQMFYLDVSKVDMVLHLHMLLCLYTHALSVSSISDICCKCFI
jgi:hypothetical protein